MSAHESPPSSASNTTEANHNTDSNSRPCSWTGRIVLNNGVLNLQGIDLTGEKIAELAVKFPTVKTVDVTNARIDGGLIFSEYEISSYFPDPQRILVNGLNRNYIVFMSELDKKKL